uniref:Uncharacterized protein n=1 Tax=Amphimedon queenslandica TaxID=400682 RepID=A0A1X7U5V4_AMPQE
MFYCKSIKNQWTFQISSVNSVEFQQLVTTEVQFEGGFNKVIKFWKLTSLRKGCRKTLDFDTFAKANPEILLGSPNGVPVGSYNYWCSCYSS